MLIVLCSPASFIMRKYYIYTEKFVLYKAINQKYESFGMRVNFAQKSRPRRVKGWNLCLFGITRKDNLSLVVNNVSVVSFTRLLNPYTTWIKMSSTDNVLLSIPFSLFPSAGILTHSAPVFDQYSDDIRVKIRARGSRKKTLNLMESPLFFSLQSLALTHL